MFQIYGHLFAPTAQFISNIQFYKNTKKIINVIKIGEKHFKGPQTSSLNRKAVLVSQTLRNKYSDTNVYNNAIELVVLSSFFLNCRHY